MPRGAGGVCGREKLDRGSRGVAQSLMRAFGARQRAKVECLREVLATKCCSWNRRSAGPILMRPSFFFVSVFDPPEIVQPRAFDVIPAAERMRLLLPTGTACWLHTLAHAQLEVDLASFRRYSALQLLPNESKGFRLV